MSDGCGCKVVDAGCGCCSVIDDSTCRVAELEAKILTLRTDNQVINASVDSLLERQHRHVDRIAELEQSLVTAQAELAEAKAQQTAIRILLTSTKWGAAYGAVVGDYPELAKLVEQYKRNEKNTPYSI